jgi:hypothetical protein
MSRETVRRVRQSRPAGRSSRDDGVGPQIRRGFERAFGIHNALDDGEMVKVQRASRVIATTPRAVVIV